MRIYENGDNPGIGTEPELDDETFAELIGIGFLIGIPATFLVMFAGLLLATGLTAAAPAIAWAALVGGGYFGGFVVLSAHLAGIENRERLAARQARSADDRVRLAALTPRRPTRSPWPNSPTTSACTTPPCASISQPRRRRSGQRDGQFLVDVAEHLSGSWREPLATALPVG